MLIKYEMICLDTKYADATNFSYNNYQWKFKKYKIFVKSKLNSGASEFKVLNINYFLVSEYK